MIHALRWLLLLPGVLASWFIVFSVFADGYLGLTAPCDSAPTLPECTAPLHVFLVLALPSFGAAVSAVLVLVVTFLIAPAAKVEATRLCFCVGVAFAFTGAWTNALLKQWDMFFAACAAMVVGTIAVKIISRFAKARERSMVPNISPER